jgi:hypothetical protein
VGSPRRGCSASPVISPDHARSRRFGLHPPKTARRDALLVADLALPTPRPCFACSGPSLWRSLDRPTRGPAWPWDFRDRPLLLACSRLSQCRVGFRCHVVPQARADCVKLARQDSVEGLLRVTFILVRSMWKMSCEDSTWERVPSPLSSRGLGLFYTCLTAKGRRHRALDWDAR